MTAELHGVMAALSPGLVGFFLGAALGYRWYRDTPGAAYVFAGSGGVLAYLALALYIRWQDAQGAQVFSPALQPVLWFLLALAVCLLFWARPWGRVGQHVYPEVPGGGVGSGVLALVPMSAAVALLLALLAQNLAQVAINPLTSWDGLGLWTTWGEWFLHFDLDPEGARGRTRAEYGSFPWKHPRHPPTVYHLSAFSGYALTQTELLRGWLVPWSFIWLCGAAAVWGCVRACCTSRWMPAFAVVAYCSLPLLENHAILVGYADFWVAIVVTIAAAILAVALMTGNVGFWVVGLLCAVTPVGMKNTGILYSAALILPLLVIFGAGAMPRVFLALSAALIAAACWFYLVGFDLNLAGRRFALIRGDDAQVLFGGYKMAFEPYPLVDILRNEVWAFLVHQSFSIVALLLAVAIATSFLRGNALPAPHRRALLYLSSVAVALILAFMLPQFITRYAERFAEPGSDLGGSRFLLAVGPVAIMAMAIVVRSLETPQHDAQ
mgnify:CR=1 FL=1